MATAAPSGLSCCSLTPGPQARHSQQGALADTATSPLCQLDRPWVLTASYSETISDIQQRCNNSREFPSPHPASSHVNILQNQATMLKPRNEQYTTLGTKLQDLFRFHEFPHFSPPSRHPPGHLVVTSPWSPPIGDRSSVFPCFS